MNENDAVRVSEKVINAANSRELPDEVVDQLIDRWTKGEITHRQLEDELDFLENEMYGHRPIANDDTIEHFKVGAAALGVIGMGATMAFFVLRWMAA